MFTNILTEFSAHWERTIRARRELGRNMNTQEKGCYLKKRFTEDEAVELAEHLSGKTGARHNGYRCDQCGEWHVGRVRAK